MKKVLFIANQFPPFGGSGVQRSLKFVKFLREFGYEPVVVTKKRSSIHDGSFMKDIPPGTEIIEVEGRDFDSMKGIIGKIMRFTARKALIPDYEILWAKKALKAAGERLKKGDISLIYSTSFPYSDHLLASDLKDIYPELPLICDFRDEWTKNPYILDMNYGEKRMKKEKLLERRVLNKLDMLLTVTDSMLAGFLELAPELEGRAYVIPNGYDSDDFEAVPDTPSRDKLLITYAGSMYGRRKPDLFLEALFKLASERKIDLNDIKVEFIGNMKFDEINSLVSKFGLDRVVTLTSYMEHAKLLEKLGSTTCLLLIIGDGAGSINFSSGKIFEYLKMRRKILALVPSNGEAAKIIRETGSGIIADTAKLPEIEAAILKIYEDFKRGEIYPEQNEEELKKYHRREQTRRLAELFDKLTEGEAL